MELMSENLYLNCGIKYLISEHIKTDLKKTRVFDLSCPPRIISPPRSNEKLIYLTPDEYSVALKQLILRYLPPGKFISLHEPVSRFSDQFSYDEPVIDSVKKNIGFIILPLSTAESFIVGNISVYF